jgi:hypothetical protein
MQGIMHAAVSHRLIFDSLEITLGAKVVGTLCAAISPRRAQAVLVRLVREVGELGVSGCGTGVVQQLGLGLRAAVWPARPSLGPPSGKALTKGKAESHPEHVAERDASRAVILSGALPVS